MNYDTQEKILYHCTDTPKSINQLSMIFGENPLLIDCVIRNLVKKGNLKEFPDPKSSFDSLYLTIKD